MLGYVCLNGDYMPPDQARVSAFDHGYLYGDGVFETLRTYGGSPFRLDAHLDRLMDSLDLMAIAGAPDRHDLERQVLETFARSGLDEATLRLTVTRGVGKGLDPSTCTQPTVLIAALPLRTYPPEAYREGIAATFLWERSPVDRPLPTVKSTSYQRGVLARIELARQGVSEGFYLDGAGGVTEGTVSNVFAVVDGELWTPPADVCLPGITRAEVLAIARERQFPLREAPLSRETLLTASEVFVTSSLAELLPVKSLSGTVFSAPGPLTRKLHRLYQERTAAPSLI